MKKELEEKILSYIDETIEMLMDVVPKIGTISISSSGIDFNHLST